MAQIPMFFPPSVDLGHQSKSPLPHLQLVLARRTPHHRTGFYKWLFIAPLTAPFALIRELGGFLSIVLSPHAISFSAVIPNLPFFYAAWRAWSHYRGNLILYLIILSASRYSHVAWKASEYLQGLIKSNHVLPQPSPVLDEVYACYAASEALADKRPTLASHDSNSEPNDHSSIPSQPRLLLSADAIPRIRATFRLPESAGGSILRAIDQARMRIDKL